MEEEDDCPELVPIENPSAPATEQIPVTIISGYLGEALLITQTALITLPYNLADTFLHSPCVFQFRVYWWRPLMVPIMINLQCWSS